MVFCRNLSEAEEYSREFNRRGYRTEWVSGAMNRDDVETCIERLESDDAINPLDYIFTADLFNEGVDIPAVNQIVMMRPPESPIIFIQQLGRGLRHYPDKDYVVILDFIGNYEKNYNIPMALSDDRSYNKAETRRVVSTGDMMIPGNSTISFDEIAKNKIYASIDRSNFTEAKIIRETYNNLKRKLGRIPRLTDFHKNGTIDALNILSKYKSYYEFLFIKDKDFKQRLDERSRNYLKQITKYTASGKRNNEFLVLKLILNGCVDLDAEIRSNTKLFRSNVINVLDGTFYNNDITLIEKTDNSIKISSEFETMLCNPVFRDQLSQIVELAEENWIRSYRDAYCDTDFVLYMRYTYEDVCRLLNWSKNINGQNLGGYFYHETSGTFPVFINYFKGDDVAESQRYEDRFENRGMLIALSKSKKGPDSKWMTAIRNSASIGISIHLFMRKDKNDKCSKEFYYLGLMDFEKFLDSNTPVTIEYRLRNEVRSDLYDYFISMI